MRYIIIACMSMAALTAATAVSAAEPGQIPEAQLAELGLGGMEVMSDAEGEEIRGKFLFGPKITFFFLHIVPYDVQKVGVLQVVLGVNDVFRTVFPNGFFGLYPPGNFILP